MPPKYAKFQSLGPILIPFRNRVSKNCPGPSITDKDDHFAKTCVKIGRQLRKFTFWTSAFVVTFCLSLSLKPQEIKEFCHKIPKTITPINSKKKKLHQNWIKNKNSIYICSKYEKFSNF